MNREMGSMASRIVQFVFLVVMFGLPQAGVAYDTDACIDCHKLESTQSRLRIDVEAFQQSAHADNAECTDCHSRVTNEDHIQLAGSGGVDCSECHDQENKHGLGGLRENRPDCYHCHTRHTILGPDDPLATIHPDRLKNTCAQCHPAQSGRSDYLSWLPSIKIATHPKADLSGDYREDNCLGCHQGSAAHGEDELISGATCHRCHLDAEGHNPMLGFVHPIADPKQQAGVFAVALVYQIVMLLLLAGGIVFFIRKFTGPQPR